MPSFKEQILDYCIAQTDKHEGWVWEKRDRRWRLNPFPGIEIYFLMGFMFKDGFMATTQPYLRVYLKEYTELYKAIGFQGGTGAAWGYGFLTYYGLVRPISFWKEFYTSVPWREGRYDLNHVPEMLDWFFEHFLSIMTAEFDFTSREAFVKSLIIADDDPRLDDRTVMHHVGILQQSILRIMQGDFEFVRNAVDRYPKNGGFFRQQIPQVLEYFESKSEFS